MVKVFLGLGSNLGDRRNHLERALSMIKEMLKLEQIKVSRIYQTPALLPIDANSEWNQPFLNIAIEINCSTPPFDLLKILKQIEVHCGRKNSPRWSPREIDIDILMYGDLTLSTTDLCLPHPEIKKRAFVLDPLKDLAPHLMLPGEQTSVLNLARLHHHHSPIWMGIFNLTPDSFSDGGPMLDESYFNQQIAIFDDQNLGIIDIGGESTRPGAMAISAADEWTRIEPYLKSLKHRFLGRILKPLISLDTRHFENAVKAIEIGADIINDVSGLADLRFADLIQKSQRKYVLTHSLSVPADPGNTLANSTKFIDEIKLWIHQKIAFLQSRGLSDEQIIIDPGIGFGKTPLQSQILLQNINSFFDFNLPTLVGHSRKSFMKAFSPVSSANRDLESIGASIAMADKGVDILRVHNPSLHARSHLSWNHVRSPRAPMP